jgi:hypothetical protein
MRRSWYKRARIGALLLAGMVALCEVSFHPSLGTFAYFAAALGALVLLFRALPSLPASPRITWESVLRPSVLVISLLVALALGEAILRLFFARDFRLNSDEKNLCYRYDATLGWFPIPNSTRTFTASRTITAHHNSTGFRGAEHLLGTRPAIMVLGDSFVWGYDVEESERFTEKLQARHPEWVVYNLGVSGYGTDQEYLVLQKYFDTYRPKVVVLVFCLVNDRVDNSWNATYGYYKPYFIKQGDHLQLQGVPVPRHERVFAAEHPRLWKSYVVKLFVRTWFKLTCPVCVKHDDPTAAILAEMDRYVRDRGARLLVGLEYGQRDMVRMLDGLNIPYVDLGTSNRYPANGNHWTPAGHTYVCDVLSKTLEQIPSLQTAPKPHEAGP